MGASSEQSGSGNDRVQSYSPGAAVAAIGPGGGPEVSPWGDEVVPENGVRNQGAVFY